MQNKKSVGDVWSRLTSLKKSVFNTYAKKTILKKHIQTISIALLFIFSPYGNSFASEKIVKDTSFCKSSNWVSDIKFRRYCETLENTINPNVLGGIPEEVYKNVTDEIINNLAKVMSSNPEYVQYMDKDIKRAFNQNYLGYNTYHNVRQAIEKNKNPDTIPYFRGFYKDRAELAIDAFLRSNAKRNYYTNFENAIKKHNELIKKAFSDIDKEQMAKRAALEKYRAIERANHERLRKYLNKYYYVAVLTGKKHPVCDLIDSIKINSSYWKCGAVNPNEAEIIPLSKSYSIFIKTVSNLGSRNRGMKDSLQIKVYDYNGNIVKSKTSNKSNDLIMMLHNSKSNEVENNNRASWGVRNILPKPRH